MHTKQNKIWVQKEKEDLVGIIIPILKRFKSFIDNQGKEEPIYLWIRIGEKVTFI